MPRRAVPAPSPELLERSRQLAKDCLGIMGQVCDAAVVEALASKTAGHMAGVLHSVEVSKRRMARKSPESAAN